MLGFEGIRFDPLKVEAILQLSPLKNIRHLQCLQGMENFLQIFVVNFANLTRGFMHLLKKDVVVSLETIGMVLVQEDEELQEHAMYYLS